MTLSLYTAAIPAFRQTLAAVAGILTKAEAFCTETGTAPATLIGARLAPDMLDFAYQVKSVAVHSLGAIEGLRAGLFSPDFTPPPADFAGLHARIAATADALAAVDPAEVDSFADRPMVFAMGDRRIDFSGQSFLLGFSLPNFYFHATTAYNLLRWQGVAIGKRDYMGQGNFHRR